MSLHEQNNERIEASSTNLRKFIKQATPSKNKKPSYDFSDTNDEKTSSSNQSKSEYGLFDSSYKSKWNPLLKLIRQVESNVYGYNSFRAPSKFKKTFMQDPDYVPITKLTVEEVITLQQRIKQLGSNGAMGAYQILNLDKKWNVQGVSKDDIFSPVTQDKIAVGIIKGEKADKWLNGKISDKTFMVRIANQWRGLPSGAHGRTYGDSAASQNKAHASWTEFIQAITEVKQNFDNKTVDDENILYNKFNKNYLIEEIQIIQKLYYSDAEKYFGEFEGINDDEAGALVKAAKYWNSRHRKSINLFIKNTNFPIPYAPSMRYNIVTIIDNYRNSLTKIITSLRNKKLKRGGIEGTEILVISSVYNIWLICFIYAKIINAIKEGNQFESDIKYIPSLESPGRKKTIELGWKLF